MEEMNEGESGMNEGERGGNEGERGGNGESKCHNEWREQVPS